MLIAPLLFFVLLTFIAPIGDMLFRSVENNIVSDTLPRTVKVLSNWDSKTGIAPKKTLKKAIVIGPNDSVAILILKKADAQIIASIVNKI